MSVYRYVLHRAVDPLHGSGFGLFVMLNPSTADESTDDPTIRRCTGFARRFGWASYRVVNLFAVRATNPWELKALAESGVDIVGPDNDGLTDAIMRSGAQVVAAWGASGGQLAKARARSLVALNPDSEWWCLGTTADGSPRHPLYVRGDAQIVRWTPREVRT